MSQRASILLDIARMTFSPTNPFGAEKMRRRVIEVGNLQSPMGMRYYLGQSMDPDVRKAAGELRQTPASDGLLPESHI
jgi:phage FluMu protein gp41